MKNIKLKISLPIALAAFVAMGVQAAQAAIGPNGNETVVGGSAIGHKGNPDLALDENGGFVVWEFVSNNSNGSRIYVQPLNALMGPKGSPVRVSETTDRVNEKKPKISMLPSGGAVIVWEAGSRKDRNVYARFVDASGRPLGGAQTVNAFDRGNQDNPDVAVNQKGDVWVVWESEYQDGARDGVYARRFNAQGIKVGSEMQVSQTIKWNQFNPAITTLKDGKFVFSWISEVEQGKQLAMAGTGSYGQAGGSERMKQVSVPFMRSHVMGRLLNTHGRFIGNEFRVDGGHAVCSNPDIAGLDNGGFAVVWEELNESGLGLGQDVYVRQFSKDAQPTGPRKQHNKITAGNQGNPSLAATQGGVLVVWNCGSNTTEGEEIHGRLLSGGAEIRINENVQNRQYMVGASGNAHGKIMVVWADVDDATQIILKGKQFTTANPAINLADGPDVKVGGQGATRIILVAQKEKITPSRMSMVRKKEQLANNMVVRHESVMAEAMRVTQQAVKNAAANAVQNAAAKNSNQKQARNIARVSAPQGISAVARPVNAQIKTPSINRVNGGNPLASNVPSSVAPAGGSGSGGIASAGVRVGMARQSISIQVQAQRNGIAQAPTAFNPSANTMGSRGGIHGGIRGGMSGGQNSVQRVTSQAARNTLLSQATQYQGARRLGMRRQVPGVRTGTINVTAANRARSSIQNGLASGSGSRGLSASATGRRPVTLTPQNRTVGQTPPQIAGRTTIGNRFGGGTSDAQRRMQMMREQANRNTTQAQQNKRLPVPSTVSMQNGRMNLRFNSQAGNRYVVEMSNDRSNWNQVGRPQVGTGRSMSVPIQSKGQRYIRVVPRD